MKLLKRISMLLTALCMLLGACALAACGDEGDKITYTATVTLEDGTPVAGVKVSWGDNGPYTTNAQGVASAKLESGTYILTVDENSLPEGTSVSGTVTVTAKVPSTKITLTSSEDSNNILYTVKVLYPDGSPVEGVMVGLCLTGATCTFFPLTDANGVTSKELAAETYNVQIPSPPAGYDYDKDEHNYYTGAQATVENPSVTITLKAV